MKSLERTYGLRLLERKGKRICLTSNGEDVYEYGTRIASLADMAEKALVQRKAQGSCRISIGAGLIVVSCLLPAILPQWISQHPFVHVSITQGQALDLQKKLLEGNLDLFISAGTKWASQLRTEFAFSDKLVVISSADHPLAARDLVTVAELSEEKMILTPNGSALRSEIEEVEYQYGVRFRVEVEVDRLDPVKLLCRAGVGIAVLPMLAVGEEVGNKQLSLLNVEGFPRNRPYFVVYPADKVLTAEVRSFLQATQLWSQRREEAHPLRL